MRLKEARHATGLLWLVHDYFVEACDFHQGVGEAIHSWGTRIQNMRCGDAYDVLGIALGCFGDQTFGLEQR